MAVTAGAGPSMNSNAAVFGICNPETAGYGSGPASVQGYPPGVTSEHLSAFYGSAASSAGSGSAPSSGGGSAGSVSGAEPSSPSPYGSGGAGQHTSERSHGSVAPETKYEPSHSPGAGAGAGIISSDNGLQYANLDGSELKGYPGYPGSGSSHPHQAYQAHHSLVQATYAHHYGKGRLSIKYLSGSLHFKLSPFPIARVHEMLSLSSADCWTLKV